MIEESESARRAPTPRQDASRAPPICPGPLPIALVNMMESRTGLRTVISNDANAAAIGEMTYGAAAAGLRNFIVPRSAQA